MLPMILDLMQPSDGFLPELTTDGAIVQSRNTEIVTNANSLKKRMAHLHG
jgi:hypothetical protein